MNPTPDNPSTDLGETNDIVAYIDRLLKPLRFGSIEIVVHDGRIVQIDKHEKFRLKGSQATH